MHAHALKPCPSTQGFNPEGLGFQDSVRCRQRMVWSGGRRCSALPTSQFSCTDPQAHRIGYARRQSQRPGLRAKAKTEIKIWGREAKKRERSRSEATGQSRKAERCVRVAGSGRVAQVSVGNARLKQHAGWTRLHAHPHSSCHAPSLRNFRTGLDRAIV
jgi:hypothetical protein